jgi:alkylhydroperoxidase family enzyme
VLADWRTAPVDERLRATLGFLEQMTLRPEELTPADAEAVRAAGVSEGALVDAVHVAALFSMIVRMADALGFEPPGPEYLKAGAPRMLAGGYALA